MLLSSMCHPCRGFLFILDAFSHRSRGGLRCFVPPGLPATEIAHYQRAGGICKVLETRHSSSVLQPGAMSPIVRNVRNCFRASQFKCANVKLPTIFHCWEIAAHPAEWLELNPVASPAKPTIENGVAN